MTDFEISQLVKHTVEETIEQLREAGLLRSVTDQAYKDASAELKKFYADGENRPDIESALAELKGDKYYKIIPLYFNYGYTIEEIAEIFQVEVSTISRNKKRLTLKIWERRAT